MGFPLVEAAKIVPVEDEFLPVVVELASVPVTVLNSGESHYGKPFFAGEHKTAHQAGLDKAGFFGLSMRSVVSDFFERQIDLFECLFTEVRNA